MKKLSAVQIECLRYVIASPTGCGVIDGGAGGYRRGKLIMAPVLFYIVSCPRAYRLATMNALESLGLLEVDRGAREYVRMVPTIAAYTAVAMGGA